MEIKMMEYVHMKLIQLPDSQELDITFEMQTAQVTQELYEEVIGVNPSYFKGKNLPVERVSWFDAIKFCNRASELQGLEPCYEISNEGTQVHWNKQHNGLRLPTEIEWEYACRAGSDVDPVNRDLLAQAGCWENFDASTQPAGIKQPNSWGLYDMLGNVWEWCWDLWEPNTRSRVVRGGLWDSNAYPVRAAFRGDYNPAGQYSFIGFRCSRTVR